MANLKLKRKLEDHIQQLRSCTLCPKMQRPPVPGNPVPGKVLLVGQAPGVKEPLLNRPFAWTAGKTLFGWFHAACGMTEAEFRESIYMAAVCRCFPGKNTSGGDRVPDAQEIANCSRWLNREIELLQPELVLPVGKLAISQFIASTKLTDLIGHVFPVQHEGAHFDLIPLPHPSGASPWHRIEPGKTLLSNAMKLIVAHPAWPKRDHTNGQV